ncbi:MAG: PIG-L family deacetylase [Actinomycetota bacterium]
MATLVCFHAHPDDEAISTGGTMAKAATEGHRVVLVVATGGEHGEVPDDLAEGETLVDRRRAETERSCATLGVERLEFLGYRDSGMTGWDQNADPSSFHQSDLDEAAERLATILRDEAADVVTIYDWHGVYGHPDHIKVHTVGKRAAELAAASGLAGLRVLEATANRDEMIRQMTDAIESGEMTPPGGEHDGGQDDDFDPGGPADDGNPFGEPESVLTLRVDVTDHIDAKRSALRSHRSQVTDSSFFLEMSDEVFTRAFGTEWFIEHDRQPPWRDGWIFEDV